jgi:hypothetical protein
MAWSSMLCCSSAEAWLKLQAAATATARWVFLLNKGRSPDALSIAADSPFAAFASLAHLHNANANDYLQYGHSRSPIGQR